MVEASSSSSSLPSSSSSTLKQRKPHSQQQQGSKDKDTSWKEDDKLSFSPSTPACPPPQTSPLWHFLGTLGGMVDFCFFGKPPAYVNLALPAGMTSQLASLQHYYPDYWRSIVTGHFLLCSPNLVWLAIAAIVHVLAPYELEHQQQQQ